MDKFYSYIGNKAIERMRLLGKAVLVLGVLAAIGSCTEDKSVGSDGDNSPPVDLLELVSIDPSRYIFSDTGRAVSFRANFNRDVRVDLVSFTMSPWLSSKILFRPDAVLLIVTEPLDKYLNYSQALKVRVIDSYKNVLEIDTTWSFRFVTDDSISPSVSSIIPQGDISNTDQVSQVEVIFDEPVDTASVSLVFSPHVSGTVELTDSSVVFIPKESFLRGVSYQSHLTAVVFDSVTNLASVDTTWRFWVSIEDTISPIIQSITPSVNGQNEVSALQSEVCFAELVDTANLTFEFTPAVSGAIVLTDSSLVFLPELGFLSGVGYLARFSGSVFDSIGNETIIDTAWLFSVSRGSTVYVSSEARAGGNGSIVAPFNSIQAAVNLVSSTIEFNNIQVASGAYEASISISEGLNIIGGFDPQTWEPSPDSRTIIRGTQIDGVAIGMLIKDVSSEVSLVNLAIEGADAVSPGASSYGLYCLNSAGVTLRASEVGAGMGAPGDSGGVFAKAQGGEGGFGGSDNGSLIYDPSTQTHIWQSEITYATSGKPGFCADGAQSGGIENSGDGPGGVQYIPPIGRVDSLIERNLDIFLEVAERSGCGGGGGHGGRVGSHGNTTGGRSGGNGGKGGFGGQGGGLGVSILVINTQVAISKSVIKSFSGGRGGYGTEQTDGFCDYYIPCNGAPGGDGGGGAGGASIGILTYYLAPTIGANVVFNLGTPGAGGFSGGNTGADGVAIETLTVQ